MRLKRRRIFIFIFSLLICLSANCSTIPDTSSCKYSLDPKWIEQIPHVLDKLLEHSPYISSVQIKMYANQKEKQAFWVNPRDPNSININLCQTFDFQSIDEFAFVLAHEIGHLEDYAHQKAARHIGNRILPKDDEDVPEYRKLLESEQQTLQAKAQIIDIEAAQPYLSKNEFHKEPETYADLRGAIITHRAGFNPCAFIHLFYRKKRNGKFLKAYKHHDKYFSMGKIETIASDYINKKLGIQCS